MVVVRHAVVDRPFFVIGIGSLQREEGRHASEIPLTHPHSEAVLALHHRVPKLLSCLKRTCGHPPGGGGVVWPTKELAVLGGQTKELGFFAAQRRKFWDLESF